jgi:hypothetical protein
MLRKPNKLRRLAIATADEKEKRKEKKRKKEKGFLKILAMDRLMPYGHGGEYWGRPVRDGCMQMLPNRARPATGAGVLEWSPSPP